jgi:hypothetical protein
LAALAWLLVAQLAGAGTGPAASFCGSEQAYLAWQRAFDDSALRLLQYSDRDDRDLGDLLVIEPGCDSGLRVDEVETLVREGGAVFLSGLPSGSHRRLELDLLALAGLALNGEDPALANSFPRLVRDSALLAPLEPGDAIRFGAEGMNRSASVRPVEAKVLAESARINAASGFVAEPQPEPSISYRRLGKGLVLWAGFALGDIAACRPGEGDIARDCSAAATAEVLMRTLLANLLYEHAGQQLLLPWFVPGSRPGLVVLTGDVHADAQGHELGAAIELARMLERHELPLSLFVVGSVAESFPVQFAELAGLPNVEILTHSARGQQYRLGQSFVPGRRRGGVHGEEAVCEDVRQAERMLGLEAWPQQRTWRNAIRTEGWGSNQTESSAWSGMACAGIGLVFDQNGDQITTTPVQTAPTSWFEHPARSRLFLPAPTAAVTTANDDFILDPALRGQIRSIPAPEPEPCCNPAVSLASYADYVIDWSEALGRAGRAGGFPQVWLWHPITLLARDGLASMEEAVLVMKDNDDLMFMHAGAYAAWLDSRSQGQLTIDYADDGAVAHMEWRHPADRNPVTPPPLLDSRRANG